MTPTNEEIIKGNRVIAENVELKVAPFNYGLIRVDENGEYDFDEIIYYSPEYDWSDLMPAIELIRDQMGLHTVWQTMKALQENYTKVGPEDFQTITDVWKAVVIYFESKK